MKQTIASHSEEEFVELEGDVGFEIWKRMTNNDKRMEK